MTPRTEPGMRGRRRMLCRITRVAGRPVDFRERLGNNLPRGPFWGAGIMVDRDSAVGTMRHASGGVTSHRIAAPFPGRSRATCPPAIP
jgi:hypothetical protein